MRLKSGTHVPLKMSRSLSVHGDDQHDDIQGH